jgi:hypothetical protein
MIELITKSIDLNVSAEQAFTSLVAGIDQWWPKRTHSLTALRGGPVPPTVVFEAAVGGRIYEIDNENTEHPWGEVGVFEDGERVVFSWHVGRPADQATEVEIHFKDVADGGSRVELEHRAWERISDDPRAMRDRYDSGWDMVLGQCFRNFANSETRRG